jgi:hypothetical protein
MKSAMLHYSYSEVFKQLEKVCARNGFAILKSSEKDGEISAVRGWKILRNQTHLQISVQRKEKLVTKVFVEVKVTRKKNREIESAGIEEKLVDTIYKFF